MVVVPGFDFSEEDLIQSPYWFLDATHSVPPWTPMFGWFWVNFCRHGMQYGAETLNLPTSRGWDWRFNSGGGYLTVYGVSDPEVIRRRTEAFRVSIRPFLENYDDLWTGFKQEMLGRYEQLKAVDVERATNGELLQLLEATVDTTRRMWEIHMYMMYGVYSVYSLFEDLCQDLLGIDDTTPEFHALVSGYDNKVFQVDRRLWEFSRRAHGEGLSEVLDQADTQTIIRRLKESEVGRLWLTDFNNFLLEDGWRLQRMAEINMPSWVEDPTPALQIVRRFLSGDDTFQLDVKRQELIQDRQETLNTLITRIPPDEREWFNLLLTAAQHAGSFSEEHNHYLDLYTHAMIRRTVLAIGKRLVAAGTIDDSEDVFFLIPEDIRRTMWVPEAHRLQRLIDERRSQWKEWQQQPNPPLLGSLGIDQAIKELVVTKDPIALKVVVGSMPQVKTDVQADLYGTCGSPGLAEGTARIILDESQLGDIQPGDILVAPTTSPSWTSVFAFLKGVVVDRGASLSHAAVVGREYGIPVVMNVFDGTQKIRSGQRIRIDGTHGHVFILPDE
ncbi:MAG: phosphoenolpyruvate-utilizing protein [Nitrososphaerota archaeon]|nr:phosphoenolpyruvate-utilizing protein [Nitrososphaerota archaeon]